MTAIIGPLPCINCGRSVTWDRIGSAFRLMERRTIRHRVKHDCAVVPVHRPRGRQIAVRCGAWMPQARDRCARAAGHAANHASRYALDNAAAARRKWLPDARVAA